MSTDRYVWLNTNTGEFTDSWEKDDVKYMPSHKLVKADTVDESPWRLIKYRCINSRTINFHSGHKLIEK
jgi:hypothetical protein